MAISETRLMRGTPAAQAGILSWLMQRVTGAFLVVFLLAHLWVVHAMTSGSYEAGEIASRLQGGWWFRALDIGLLVLGLYHAINGVLRVAVEVGRIKEGTYWLLLSVAWGLGLVMLYYGVMVFNALLG